MQLTIYCTFSTLSVAVKQFHWLDWNTPRFAMETSVTMITHVIINKQTLMMCYQLQVIDNKHSQPFC